MAVPGTKRRKLLQAAAILGAVGALIAAVVAFAVRARAWHAEPPAADDAATLVTAADLKISDPGSGDEWRAYTGFEGAGHLEYRRTGLKPGNGKGQVHSIRIDERNVAVATQAFAAGSGIGAWAFKAAANEKTERVPLQLPADLADQVSGAEYQVDGKPFGSVVWLRVGSHVWMFQQIGYRIAQPTLETILRDRVERLRALDR